jgi:3-deoxy-D-manno-octulosonic-acid transferase
MAIVVDIAFLLFAIVTMPFWLVSMWKRGKLRTVWSSRLGWRLPQIPEQQVPEQDVTKAGAQPAHRILLHAVSVGEVNAARILADMLAAEPMNAQVIISVTTDTGIERARKVFGSRHTVVRYPFDFSWSVRRFLGAVKPDLVLLMELEIWPNFTRLCANRSIPIAVINGRLSARSFTRSLRVRWILSPMFRRLSRVAAQDQAYADRFEAMGVARNRIAVTGTMKWDTAEIADHVDGAEELAQEMGIDRSIPLIVAGSTALGEETLISAACPEGVQLLCAPRKPEWFDQTYRALPGSVRRSEKRAGSASGRFVLDTIGELRKAYALADLVVLGRTFGNLHGSDMMEPAGLGKVVIVGPRVDDFQSTADALIKSGGLVQTSAENLRLTIAELLADPKRREQIASSARDVIRKEQGASARHAKIAQELLQNRGAK